jgi:hypothetical protein
MSIGCEPHPGKVSNSTIIGQTGFLFTLGTIAVAAGLLFPLSSHILDVLLILNISLAIAVLIATFSARRPLEVSGFPLLILMLSMLQMAGNVASSKLILSQGDCGTIIGFVASVIVRNNGILWIPVTVALVSVIFAIIYKVVGDIGRIVSEFSTDIVPAKQGGICNCLSAGVISDRQALDLRDNIVREDRLLIAMNGTAKFVLCAAIIGLASIIANIAGGPIVAALNGTVAAIPAKTYIGLALSAGLITQVCMLIAIGASRYVVQRSSLSPVAWEERAERKTVKRVEIVDRSAEGKIVGSKVVYKPVSPPTLESQVDTKLNHAVPAECFDAEFAETTKHSDTEADERVTGEDDGASNEGVHSQADTNATIVNYGKSISWQVRSDDSYYDAVAEFISDRLTSSGRTTLMAAKSVEWLPVTVPVNISMRLAQTGQKCLLIDLDLERCAISKVFDVDVGDYEAAKITCVAPYDEANKEICATNINNLWVWPATRFARYEATSIKQIIASLKEQFDHLIMYAPTLSDDKEGADCVETAMLFGPAGESDTSSIGGLHEVLVGYGCEVLRPPAALAEAV